LGNEDHLPDNNDVFVNWRIYIEQKSKQGGLVLFPAFGKGTMLPDGLDLILRGHAAVIEDIGIQTGLEAFMLAAVEPSNNTETIYKSLQDKLREIIIIVLYIFTTNTSK